MKELEATELFFFFFSSTSRHAPTWYLNMPQVKEEAGPGRLLVSSEAMKTCSQPFAFPTAASCTCPTRRRFRRFRLSYYF